MSLFVKVGTCEFRKLVKYLKSTLSKLPTKTDVSVSRQLFRLADDSVIIVELTNNVVTGTYNLDGSPFEGDIE